MPNCFWIKRCALAFVVAAVLLFTAHLLRGHSATEAVTFAALWAAVAAAIFTLVGYVRYKRNPACMSRRSRQP